MVCCVMQQAGRGHTACRKLLAGPREQVRGSLTDTMAANAALVLALADSSLRSQHEAHQVEGLRGGHHGCERGAGAGPF